MVSLSAPSLLSNAVACANRFPTFNSVHSTFNVGSHNLQRTRGPHAYARADLDGGRVASVTLVLDDPAAGARRLLLEPCVRPCTDAALCADAYARIYARRASCSPRGQGSAHFARLTATSTTSMDSPSAPLFRARRHSGASSHPWDALDLGRGLDARRPQSAPPVENRWLATPVDDDCLSDGTLSDSSERAPSDSSLSSRESSPPSTRPSSYAHLALLRSPLC